MLQRKQAALILLCALGVVAVACGPAVIASAVGGGGGGGSTTPPPPRHLSLVMGGTGAGTVTSDPLGISCPGTCGFDFSSTDVVKLTAHPGTGSVFSAWSGAGFSGAGDLFVPMTSDAAVTATFDLAPVSFDLKGPFALSVVPVNVATGDFDRDGVLDLVAGSDSGTAFSVALGNGDATFQDGLSVVVSGAAVAATVTDFDRDGNPDVAVTNRNNNSLSILLGDGAGGFSGTTITNAGNGPQSIAAGDFDHNGKPDIAYALNGSSRIAILLANAVGGFSAPSQPSFIVGADPAALMTEDFDRDGKLDLVAVLRGDTKFVVALGLGDGTFAPPTAIELGTAPTCVALADFDGDGAVDIAVGKTTNEIELRLGQGDGSFPTGAPVDVGGPSISVAVLDVNHDGNPDLAVARGAGTNISILIGRGDGTFLSHIDVPVGFSTTGLVAGDFDRDGKDDLAAIRSTPGGNLKVLRNTTPVQPSGDFVFLASFVTPSEPRAVTAADLNHDGVLDLATTCISANRLTTFLGAGNGLFGARQDYVTPGANPFALALGDFAIDADPDIAVCNKVGGVVDLFVGDGTGELVPSVPSTVSVIGESRGIALGDFDRDGKPDLVVTRHNQLTAFLLRGTGAGDFTPFATATVNVGTNSRGVAVGDFNRDGRQDLAAANHGLTTVSILKASGDGTFDPKVDVDVGAFPQFVSTGDFDGDGDLDLVVARESTPGTIRVLTYDSATGLFNLENDYSGSVTAFYTAVGDLNGDGKLDLAVANNGNDGQGSGSVFLYFGLGPGHPSGKLFELRKTLPFPSSSSPSSVAIGDYDRDGRPDLAIGEAKKSRISIYLNTSP